MAKDEPLAAAAEFAVLVLVAVITRHPPRWCARGAAGPGPARTCCRVCRVEDGQLNVIEVGQRTARRAGCRRRRPEDAPVGGGGAPGSSSVAARPITSAISDVGSTSATGSLSLSTSSSVQEEASGCVVLPNAPTG